MHEAQMLPGEIISQIMNKETQIQTQKSRVQMFEQ